ncbi:phosphatases II, partial [Fomitiporia mediterranea MF3/22]|uniref:phosphatases II n=1 Tax=Fomitiporia mediterranea (strain MF3/22) TaxID=694068 RepID=UPI0004409CAD
SLAAAKSLHEYPELGITHILSVCPEYPEAEEARKGATISAIASRPSAQHPTHRCISIEDSEFEDILTHLPAAVAFIRDALEPRQTIPGDDDVLVHCVMGISRSTTVVCAYLMATRQLSFPAALMFIRKRRPRVHPNYGFRRQLQIFGECGYFKNYPAPVQTHPAFTAWQRKKRREVCRYLSRIEDAIEIKLDNEDEPQLAIAECVLSPLLLALLIFSGCNL